MELSIGNVNDWVDSFLVLQEEENTREEDGENLAEDTDEDTEDTEDIAEDRSCMVSTWRCFSTVLEQAVRHSCRPPGLTRCRLMPYQDWPQPDLIVINNLTTFFSAYWRRCSSELLFTEQVFILRHQTIVIMNLRKCEQLSLSNN